MLTYSLLVASALCQAVSALPSGPAPVPQVSAPVKPLVIGTPPTDGHIQLSAVRHPSNTTVLPHHSGRNPRLLRRSNAEGSFYTSGWWITLSVGTPPQSFPILPDSGSDDFAILSTLVPPADQGNEALYNPSASSTSRQLDGYTYSLCYGSGFCESGDVFMDVVTIGGISFADIPVLAMTSVSSATYNALTGNIGVNYDTTQNTSPQGVLPFLRAIRPTIQDGVFTVDYDMYTSSGVIDFGWIDSSRYTGDIQYTPVDQTGGEWAITIEGFLASNTYWIYSFPIIVDTGTSASWVPQLVAQYYFAQVSGSSYNSDYSQYTYPCSETLPDFVFTLGPDYHGSIPSAYITTGESIDGGTTCLSNLNIGTGSVIWGESFLQAQFVVFDFDNGQVGFANKDTSPSATVPPGNIPSVTPTPTPQPTGSSYMCTGSSWSGTCQNQQWGEASCFTLAQTPFIYGLNSFGPDEGTCTLYSDSYCASPISSYEGIQNPGNDALNGDSIGGFMCTNPAITSVGSGTIFVCPESNWEGTCSNLDWSSWACQVLPTTLQNTVGSISPNQGNCFLYSDDHCVTVVSGSTPFQNPGSASLTYGDSVVAFMCI